MKKGKIITNAIAVFTVVSSAVACSKTTTQAIAGELCLYQLNGNMCPLLAFVGNGITAVPNAHIRANDGTCPPQVPATVCTEIVNVGINP
jgi:hypothetical protein